MSPLAELLLALGFEVSGSDRVCDVGRPPSHLAALERRGLSLVPQDGSGVTSAWSGVVVSTAIEPGNPDLVAAGRMGVPVIHRARLLADLVRERTCVAVAGTAGKTTVTGMIGWILEQAGLDPTVFAGGAVLNWVRPDATGCVRVGRLGPWVIEVDESDRSFLDFQPEWAVITNVSQDHFPLEEVERLFRQFAGRVGRTVVGWMGRPSNEELFEGLRPRFVRDGIRFGFRGREVRLAMLGIHNARNAVQALALAEQIGVKPTAAIRALAGFRGIARRLEIVGRAHGITVVDDYAHNPAKIRAGWETLASGHRRVLGVWRPHGFGPLALMADDLEAVFVEIMRQDDVLFLLPVYYAGGTVVRVMTSDDLADRLVRRGLRVQAVADVSAVERAVLGQVSPGDAVLVMGARDPDLPVWARRLADLLAQAGPAARYKSS